MKRAFAIFGVMLALFVCVVPCFAEEVSEGVSEVPTVNLSEDSINAIAQAVGGSQYTATVTNKSGVTYDVPSICESYWDSNPYVVRVVTTGQPYPVWFMSSEPFAMRRGDEYIGQGFVFHYVGTAWKVFERDFTESMVYGTPSWSNFDLYDTETERLVYSSDVTAEEEPPPVYTISFDTGFEDLNIESQLSNSFDPPSPVRDGSVFVGWYLDDELTTAYNSSFVFSEDTTLYAKWTDEPPMMFFADTIFDSLTVILSCESILYLVSLMALCVVVGIVKSFVKSRA